MLENILEVDKLIFFYINDNAGSIWIVDFFIKLVVNEYFVLVTLALVLVFIWFNDIKNRSVLSMSFLSVGLVNIIIYILNQIIIKPRPFEEMTVNLFYYRPTDPTFPSNAAAVSFAIATAIFIVNKKLGLGALALSFIYAFSRVYVGVHYPSDVIMGAILGVSSTYIVNKFPKLNNYITKFLEKVQIKLKLNF